MQEPEDKKLERLKQINTAAECSLEVGLTLVLVMIVIFFVLIQDEPNIVLFVLLALGLFTMTILSYESSGIVKRASGLLLPWYLWIIKSFCYFISGGNITGHLIVEYIISFVFMIVPAIICEYSAPSALISGVGLRIFFLFVAVFDLLPFEDSNPFLSIEKGITRSIILSVLYVLYSARFRYDQPSGLQEDYILTIFIRIQYAVFAGFWISVVAGSLHAVYLCGIIILKLAKRPPPIKRANMPPPDEDEEQDEAPSPPPVHKQSDPYQRESLYATQKR